MKLAIVRQTYTPYGGAERFVERALASLRERGLDVTVIARNWQGEAGPGYLRCDPPFLGRTWRDAGFARCVRGIIAEGRFDLVQSHERVAGCHIYRAGDGVHATWLEQRARARGRLDRIGARLSPWHRYTLAAEAALFRHPGLRAVICNSAMVKDDIARRFGIDDSRLPVIYNGVDLDQFQPGLRATHRQSCRAQHGLAATAPIVLFVGSGYERKGLPALLRAMARMGRRDALLVVVGRDRRQRQAEALAAQLGLGERVRFVGGQKDVRPFLAAADVFCLPTLYDPMPNAALEALACGLPVVTSTTCGAAELIRPGVGGDACDPLDTGTLAARLDDWCGKTIDAEAIRAGVAHLGLDAMAAQLAGLYQRLGAPARL